MAKIDSALHLAAAGYRVFPLEPDGKRPVFVPELGHRLRWSALATADVDRIHEWWGRWPDANIGVAAGRGLLVIDADCKVKNGVRERGLESLALLDDLGLPEGFRVRTASGGVHVYLRCAEDVGLTAGAKDIDGFPGLDYRCDGGYVVGPGSVVDGVPYVAI